MIKRRRFPKIYFGWWTVLAGGIIALWGHASHTYAISALLKPISTELGFSRAAVAVATSIGRLEGGLEAPLTGWISDKYGPRWLILAGVLMMGLGLILMNSIQSLWAFYVVWGVMIGTGVNISLTVPLRTAITNWFVKKRGIALGTQMTLSGLAAPIGLPIIVWLIINQGWRMSSVIGGVVMLLVCFPLVWFFVKQHGPEYYGLLPDGATVEEETSTTKQVVERSVKYAAEVGEVDFTLKQAMRTPAFWLVAFALNGTSLTGPALTLHAIPFLTDRGIGPLVAAGMLAMRLTVGLPVRFFGGVISDHISKRHLRFIMSSGYLLQAVGTAIFLLQPTLAMIYVWFILDGLGQGAVIAIYPLMVGRYFGRKAYGSIFGLTTALMTPASIVAPIYFGWVYDTTGSYISAFKLVTVMLAFSGTLAALIRPPKPPAQITDVRRIM